MEDDEKVLDTFTELKHQNSSYELKKIHNHYYVYLSFGRRDAALGRVRKVSLYKGKITEDGTFISVKRKQKDHSEKAAQDTVPECPAESSNDAPLAEGYPNDMRIRESSLKYEKTLLTALSMNGRISLPVLSRMLGLSVNATDWQVKSLEKRYGIWYIPEIDVTKFGYIRFLVTVKFVDNAPSAEKLRVTLSGEPLVQMVMLVKGEFDLIIYLLAKDAEEADHAVISLRDKLDTYDSVWTTIPLYGDYGFIRIRDEFIDLLKERGELLEREYAVLRELNRDAKIEFLDIDRKYGYDEGRSGYSYHKLKEEGKIKRITITMENLQIKHVGVMFLCVINRMKVKANRASHLANLIGETDAETNKYASIYDITVPNGSILFMPVFKYEEMEKEMDLLTNPERGIKTTALIAYDSLFGNLCYRKIDNACSIQQKILEKEYGAEKTQRMDYEETGRKKVIKYNLDIRGARTVEKGKVEFSQISEPSQVSY